MRRPRHRQVSHLCVAPHDEVVKLARGYPLQEAQGPPRGGAAVRGRNEAAALRITADGSVAPHLNLAHGELEAGGVVAGLGKICVGEAGKVLLDILDVEANVGIGVKRGRRLGVGGFPRFLRIIRVRSVGGFGNIICGRAPANKESPAVG